MIRHLLPLLFLTLPDVALAGEPTAASGVVQAAEEAEEPPVSSPAQPAGEAREAPAGQQAPTPAAGEQTRWFFTATGKGEQGPVSTAELRGLMKIKVVDGGTALRRDGQAAALYPGDVPELTDLIKWYFVLRGKKTGPVGTAQLKKLVKLGVVDSKSRVWRAGMARWRVMGEVVELGGKEPPPSAPEVEEEEPVDPRMARFLVSFGPHLGGSFFSNAEGMGMLTAGGRFSAYYMINPTFHMGLHATYTFIDGDGLDEEVLRTVEGLHDFAFGLTAQVGRQFSDRLWVGFGLDLGASAIRQANMIRADNIKNHFDVGAHLYTAPRAQLIYMITSNNTRMGLQVSLAVPLFLADVDFSAVGTDATTGAVVFSESSQGLKVWSGLYLNLEIVLGVR